MVCVNCSRDIKDDGTRGIEQQLCDVDVHGNSEASKPLVCNMEMQNGDIVCLCAVLNMDDVRVNGDLMHFQNGISQC